MHYCRVSVIFVGGGVNFILAVEVILGFFEWYSTPSLQIRSSSISTMFFAPEANVHGLLWLPSALANRELWQEIRRKEGSEERENTLLFPHFPCGKEDEYLSMNKEDRQCDVLFPQCLPTVLNMSCYMKPGSILRLNKRMQARAKNEQPQETRRALLPRWQPKLKIRKQSSRAMLWADLLGAWVKIAVMDTLSKHFVIWSLEIGSGSWEILSPTLTPNIQTLCNELACELSFVGKSVKNRNKPRALCTYLISAQMQSLTFEVGVCPLGEPSHCIWAQRLLLWN